MPASGSPPYRHTFTLPEPATLEMVATMYDADGWGSGGVTDVLSESWPSNPSERVLCGHKIKKVQPTSRNKSTHENAG